MSPDRMAYDTSDESSGGEECMIIHGNTTSDCAGRVRFRESHRQNLERNVNELLTSSEDEMLQLDFDALSQARK